MATKTAKKMKQQGDKHFCTCKDTPHKKNCEIWKNLITIKHYDHKK